MIQEEGSTPASTDQTNDSTLATPNTTEELTTLAQSINALKSLNPKTNYQVDTYVDACDSYSTWRVAKIVTLKDDVAKVNFDGWSSKWDETIKVGGAKIAPFKKWTGPYTGGVKSAIRDFVFEDSRDYITKTIEQLNSFTSQKLKIADPYLITQALRGRVYVLIDAILSLSQPLKTAADQKLVSDLMESFIDFFVEYLNVLPSLLKEYIDGKALNQQLLYLVNEKIALVCCIPELFDTMNKLFGGNARHKLFQNNEFPPKTYTSSQAIKPKDKYSAGYFNQILNNINNFASSGGFDKLLNLFKWELKTQQEGGKNKSESDKETVYRFPLNYAKYILHVVSPITQFSTSSFKDKFGQDLRIAFFERLDKLTTRDLKDNDSQILPLIRDSLPVFEDFLGKDAYTVCEQAELETTLSILKSPFLERKIKALNEFKDFFDRADPQVDSRQLGEKRRFRYWTNDKIKSWIIQKKILEYVIGEQSHVELLKRSIPIMKFLANTNALTQENLDLLWKGYNSTHEEYVRAVFDAIIELSLEISVDNIDYLFTKIKEIPMEKYNEPVIDLISKFTSNGMKVAATASSSSYFAKAIKRTPKYEFYGLKLLWESIQDGSPMKEEFTQTAFSSLASLIKNQSFKAEREKYLTACFENLKRGVSVPQSLLLSLHILTTYNTQSGIIFQSSSLEEVVTKLQKEHNLLETVVQDFERYVREVKIVLKGLKEKGSVPADKQAYCFVGRYSHAQNIDNRLLFLENIGLQVKKDLFTIDHLKSLWSILVKKAATDVEKNAFLKWVMKSKTTASGKKNPILSDTLLRNFFNNVLCDPSQMENFKIVTPEIFQCFEKCFEIINEREDNIEVNKNGISVVRFQSLVGYEVLWEMLLNCPNEAVLKNIKTLLANIHLKIASSAAEDKFQIWQSFIQRWVESFQIASQQPEGELMVHVISLLNLFVDLLDGRKYINRDGPATEKVDILVVDKKDDKTRRRVAIPANGTLFLLRKKIAEEFGLQTYEFDMYTTQNYKISHEIEDLHSINSIMSNDKDKEVSVLINLRSIVSGTSLPNEKFKTALANNQTIMDVLYDLLGSKNTKIVNDIWEVLSFLPFNKSIRVNLEKLPVESEKEWFSILDVTCTRKLLYCLRIVSDLSMNQGNVSEQWSVNFIKKKGFDHLFKIFFKIEDKELSSVFNCQAAANVIKLISFFIDTYSKQLNLGSEKISETLHKVLNGLSLVTQNGFIADADDPHLQEDLQKPAEEFIIASFEMLKTCIKANPELIRHIYEFPDLEQLIRNGLIECNDQANRIDFADGLVGLVQLMNQADRPADSQGAYSFFLSFLLRDLLDYAFSHRDKCKEFFTAIDHIFKQCEEKDIEAAKIDFFDLANELSQKIISLPPFEAQLTDQDYLLQGLMGLLRLVFFKKPSIKDEILLKAQPGLLHEILHNCLFEIPSALAEKGVITGPKCKSKESRKSALLLLQIMTTGANEITAKAVEYLKTLTKNNFWRTSNNSDWYIVPMTSERSKTGYVGLENLGCTCYVNSLMQQLFMISDFRDTLLETEDKNEGKIESHENLFHQVQLIFGALKISQRQYYDPRLFTYAFKDYSGNPMNVLEQMDVDEFFNNILDKLENSIKGTPNDGIIKRIFGGVLSNELICKGCPHYSEREEPCLAISLQVKNKKNIMESLQAFTQGEMLEGDNAYLCERCDKKVPTLKRVCIKKLPNILMLVLKRFEFDFDTMQRFKVNDYCEFPEKLNMMQYTQGYLKKKEGQKDENNEENAEGDAAEYPPEYYNYTLRGTVIHMGTADSGHYYSFIKDNANEWFEFNDSIVRPFDLKDLGQEAFGGEEKFLENIGNSKEVKERSRNAYLLFYEREAYFDENANKIPTMLVGNQDRDQRSKIENMMPQILKETKEDNFKFHTTKYIWDRDYGDYIFRLVEQLAQRKDLGTPTQSVLETAKFCALFFMTVILRGQERIRLPRFLRELKVIFRACPPLCSWFLEAFTYPDIIKEFLVDCTVKDMKYFVLGLLRTSLKNTYNDNKDLPYEEFEKSLPCKFISSIIFVMHDQQAAQIKLLDKVFDVLASFSGLGPLAREFLVKKKMVGRLIYYMAPEKPPVENYKDYTEEFAFDAAGKESDLGQPNVTSGVKAKDLVKSVSEMISKKKEKIMMDQVSVNYNSLVETLANIAGAVQAPGAAEEEGKKSLELTKDENLLLYNNSNVVKLILIHATSKRARKVASNFIASLVTNNEEYSREILVLLDKELRERDDIQLKVCLQALEKLMLIHDDHQKLRVEKGMTILMNVIKDNSKYYRCTEICLDYLFKLCSRNSWALRLCAENKSFLKFVESWLREYSNPYQGFSSGNLKLFKKKQAKIVETVLLQQQSKFISKSQERLAKLKKVNKNESEELAPEYDSDEDYSDHQYQIGEKIDFLHENGNWVSATVSDSLDEMIKISLAGDYSQWIYYDSDKTGPQLKVQSHTKNNVDFYKT